MINASGFYQGKETFFVFSGCLELSLVVNLGIFNNGVARNSNKGGFSLRDSKIKIECLRFELRTSR